MKVSKTLLRKAAVLALFVVGAAVWAAPASAQRGKWWHDDTFKRELGLTTEQSARLEDIFQKTAPVLRQRMQALDRAEEVFDRLVEKGDDAAVMGQVESVEAARADLNKERTLMLLRMRRALTADQWAKFTALAQAERTAARPPDRRPN
jgi:Spy/CpxP family protein refolding chaperone